MSRRRQSGISNPTRKVIRRMVAEFPPPTPQLTPCRLWQGGLNGQGYGRKWVSALQKHVLMHRWVWMQAHGPIPEGMCVLHRCDQPLCCRYDHLFLGSLRDNASDMLAKGRHNPPRMPGESHPQAKLTDDIVRFIRNSPETIVDLARLLGVNTATVGRARRRQTWTHVE